MNFYQEQLRQLALGTSAFPLDDMIRGIEKENLRVDALGRYVTTPHPEAFGSALMHPFITTDFSESLLECVTQPTKGRRALFDNLEAILIGVTEILERQKEPEFLWPYSMPYLESDEQVNNVPLANYGSSHRARMKKVYRKGLVSRYGNAMQLIAGIHYNISFPPQLLLQLGGLPDFPKTSGQALISQRYMGLIRNFIRYQWVFAYLFGASPACFSASLRNKPVPCYLHEDRFGSFVGKHACSLRLGDLGYNNSAQSSIHLDFQCIEKYAKDLLMATHMPDSRLLDSDVIAADGSYQQLNRNLLQLENEYYFNIRPKPNPVISGGVRPAVALYNHGVEYVEFRGLDLDPLSPLGLSPKTAAFCDLFLFYLMLMKSPELSYGDKMKGACNLRGIVESGRHPRAQVVLNESQVPVGEAMNRLLDEMEPLARWMDQAESPLTKDYSQALNQQRQVALGKDLNLSAQWMNQWSESALSLQAFLLQQQQSHTDYLKKRVLPEKTRQAWEMIASDSLKEQAQLEGRETGSFEEYLQAYFSQGIQ